MGSKDLEEFLNKNAKKDIAEAKEKEINWEEEKNKWLKAVERFYADIEQWLKPFLEKQQMKIIYNPIILEEEYIGRYNTKCMCIQVRDSKVILEPIGTLLIGINGRIDMKGKNGVAKFFLVNEKSEGFKINVRVGIGKELPLEEEKKDEDKQKLVWKFVTPPPDVKFVFLDGDLFADVLLEIIK